MATQDGIIRISGQLGDLVFYKRKKKDVVRKQAIVVQQSENSKKSSKDFGTASKNAAYIRKAFAPLVRLYTNSDLINRLNKRLNEIFKTIPSEHSGSKKLIDGNIGLLAGFEFNSATPFQKLLFINLQCRVETNGLVNLAIPKSILSAFIKLVPHAEAAALQLMVFSFDLQNDSYETYKINDLHISLKNLAFPGAKLSLPIDVQGNKALLIAIGISYFKKGLRFGDRRYFACKISHAFHLSNGNLVEFVEPKKQKTETILEEQGLNWAIGEG